MKLKRARIIQIISILVIQGLVLIALQALLPGLRITSFWSALGAALGYSIAQAVFWYVFIEFLSLLPEILYLFFTFVLSGVAVFQIISASYFIHFKRSCEQKEESAKNITRVWE